MQEIISHIDQKSKDFPNVIKYCTSKVENESSDEPYTTYKLAFYFGAQRIQAGPGPENAEKQRLKFIEDKIIEGRAEIFLPARRSVEMMFNHLQVLEMLN
jgi:hypothetical protein